MAKKKPATKKTKKRTRPSKVKLPIPREKNKYESEFENNLPNLKAPELCLSVKTEEIKVNKKTKKVLTVSVLHPNLHEKDGKKVIKVLQTKHLPLNTDLNKAFEIGRKMKAELAPTIKTWVRGSDDDPTYKHDKKGDK